MKYELLSLFAGACCKLYDDLDDNELLESFKTPFILEVLKGFHYVSFTSISLQSAAFFYFNYFLNFLHLLTNKNAYSNPYENSVIFTFGILFFILNKSDLFVDFNFYDLICVVFGSVLMYTEHLICPDEISMKKLLCRIIFFIGFPLGTLWMSWIQSPAIEYSCWYQIGYGIISSFVQYYSLFVAKPPVEEEKPPLDKEEKPPLDKEEKQSMEEISPSV
jgi:hypothetical protein